MAGQEPFPVIKRERIADFVNPTGYFRNERNVAGPLRMGTAPGCGPRGLVAGGGASDFETDHTTPRWFDPLGTPNERAPTFPKSTLLSRAVRSRSQKE
jgi:hypothetical protein